jgi:FkbM family methyltransferase
MFKSVLRFFYWHIYKQTNFSQENEEQVLQSIFSKTKNGFYVDVGCHHPKRFSNTALLYKQGWKGINIDANSKNLKLFNFFRKRDFNIRALVSESEAILDYYYFNDSALNGCLSNSKVDLLLNKNYKVIKTEKILTRRLDDIITESKVNHKRIDLLDIDVEGLDFQVLRSINLDLYDVRVILIETGDQENAIIEYLLKFNYHLHTRVDRNCIFLKKVI